jgi:hypothetical protein
LNSSPSPILSFSANSSRARVNSTNAALVSFEPTVRGPDTAGTEEQSTSKFGQIAPALIRHSKKSNPDSSNLEGRSHPLHSEGGEELTDSSSSVSQTVSPARQFSLQVRRLL